MLLNIPTISLTLAGALVLQAHAPLELFFRERARLVDLVADDGDGHVRHLKWRFFSGEKERLLDTQKF